MKGIIYQLKEFSTNSIVDIKHVIVADTVREEVVKLLLSDLHERVSHERVYETNFGGGLYNFLTDSC